MKYFKIYITYIYILVSDAESSFWIPYTCLACRHLSSFCSLAEAYSERLQTSKMEYFTCPVNNSKPLAACVKTLNLDAWRGSEYACVQISSNNVLCHHNKRLMGYFEFLYGSGIICLPLNIPEKLHWQHLFEKPEEAETHRLYLS